MKEKDLYEEEDFNDVMDEDGDEIDDNEEEDDIIIDNNEEEVEDIEKHIDNDNNKNETKEQDNSHITANNNHNDQLNETNNNNDVLNFLLNNPITIPNDTSTKVKFPDEDNISEIKPFPHQTKIQTSTNEVDFNQALTKILSNISKNPLSTQESLPSEVYNLLINDKELIETELKKYSFTKRTDIASKIQTYLDIRSQKMKKLEQQVNDEFNKNYTFTPLVNTV